MTLFVSVQAWFILVEDDDDDDLISKALFHVKHAQLRCTMPMNNTHTHTHTRASKALWGKNHFEQFWLK